VEFPLRLLHFLFEPRPTNCSPLSLESRAGSVVVWKLISKQLTQAPRGPDLLTLHSNNSSSTNPQNSSWLRSREDEVPSSSSLFFFMYACVPSDPFNAAPAGSPTSPFSFDGGYEQQQQQAPTSRNPFGQWEDKQTPSNRGRGVTTGFQFPVSAAQAHAAAGKEDRHHSSFPRPGEFVFSSASI